LTVKRLYKSLRLEETHSDQDWIDAPTIIEDGGGAFTSDIPNISESSHGAATSVTDGGTIAHGLSTTPISVIISASIAGEIASVTAISATTFTVALKTGAGAPGTIQTVYWRAEV
jgi:hypothetical protein